MFARAIVPDPGIMAPTWPHSVPISGALLRRGFAPHVSVRSVLAASSTVMSLSVLDMSLGRTRPWVPGLGLLSDVDLSTARDVGHRNYRVSRGS